MADLTVEKVWERKLQGPFKMGRYPLAASSTIKRGAYVCANSSGDATNGDSSVNGTVLGIADESVATSNGDTHITVILEGVFKLTVVDADDDDNVGDIVYLGADDNSYTVTSATGLEAVGRIEEFVTGTTNWVRLVGEPVRDPA